MSMSAVRILFRTSEDEVASQLDACCAPAKCSISMLIVPSSGVPNKLHRLEAYYDIATGRNRNI